MFENSRQIMEISCQEEVIEDIVALLNHYFSIENLKKDAFMHDKMTMDGFIPIDILLQFPRVCDIDYVTFFVYHCILR